MTDPATVAESVENVPATMPLEELRPFLRLYIAGSTPNSQRAETNLDTIMREMVVPPGYHAEVIDVLAEPKRALSDGVIVTPTLVALCPGNHRVMIGDLSDHPKLQSFLKTAINFI